MVADIRDKLALTTKADIITALGVIEYFTPDDLNNFFANLPSDYFLCHVAESPTALKAKLRYFRRLGYLKFKGCPPVYFYDLEQIKVIASQHGYTDIWQTEHFVTNLPQNQVQ